MKKYYKFLFIALFGLFVFVPKDTYAMNVDSFVFDGGCTQEVNNLLHPRLDCPMPNVWNNWGSGYIRFQFTITKIEGAATDWVVTPSFASVKTAAGKSFLCDIGTTWAANSTSTILTGTAMCPVTLSNDSVNAIGLSYVSQNLADYSSRYKVQVYNTVTFEQPSNFPNTSANDNANTDRIIQSQQKQLEEQQKTNKKLDEVTGSLKDVDSTLTDDDISGSESILDNFLNDDSFKDSTGLDQIIGLPLDFIKTIGKTCEPISLTIPFMNYSFTLPCISSVISANVPTIYYILSIVINGFILYRCILDLYFIVKGAKDPDDDRIEVLDL